MVQKTGLSGSTLKLVAVLTMFIDHLAAAVLIRMMLAGRGQGLYHIYNVMREIGRTAFPIYCFMLAEGVEHTKSRLKYAARIGIFALVSEVPFDLAFHSQILEFTYQNVFFTLFFGLVMLIAIQNIERRTWDQDNPFADNAVKSVLTAGAAALAMGCAYLCRTDYSFYGVFCILVLYLLRRHKWLQLAAGYLAFWLLLGEWAAFPAFLLLLLYRGKKGFSAKYFFYGFYPVHLLILYFMCVFMHIAQYSAL